MIIQTQGYKNPLSGRLRMTNEGQKIVQTIFSNVEDLHSLHKLVGMGVRGWLVSVGARQQVCVSGYPGVWG